MPNILVVDDNIDNRNVLSRLLQHGGHRTTTAINGIEALELAALTLPDLVLMDLEMPEMDGWSATRQLKSSELLARVPVIAVTGHVTSDEITRAQEAGCNDVVSKPVDYYVLMDKIRHHLEANAA